MNTIRVYWKDKFNGALVTINAADFDPAIHRTQAEGRWPMEAEASAADAPELAVEAPKAKAKRK